MRSSDNCSLVLRDSNLTQPSSALIGTRTARSLLWRFSSSSGKTLNLTSIGKTGWKRPRRQTLTTSCGTSTQTTTTRFRTKTCFNFSCLATTSTYAQQWPSAPSTKSPSKNNSTQKSKQNLPASLKSKSQALILQGDRLQPSYGGTQATHRLEEELRRSKSIHGGG